MTCPAVYIPLLLCIPESYFTLMCTISLYLTPYPRPLIAAAVEGCPSILLLQLDTSTDTSNNNTSNNNTSNNNTSNNSTPASNAEQKVTLTVVHHFECAGVPLPCLVRFDADARCVWVFGGVCGCMQMYVGVWGCMWVYVGVCGCMHMTVQSEFQCTVGWLWM